MGLSAACATYSSRPSHLLTGFSVGKLIRGGIANRWLVLIAALGSVIAVADGMTRDPNPGFGNVPARTVGI
jgi:hypothetical protein